MTAEVREAASDDRLGVRRVLDAAMLRVRDDLAERIDAGDVLVASDAENDADSTILGALVLVPEDDRERVPEDDGGRIPEHDGGRIPEHDGAVVDAVAVRRARRGQGVGSALVRAAAERYARLTAEFDPDVRPFYESLGFDVSSVTGKDDRLRGRYDRAE